MTRTRTTAIALVALLLAAIVVAALTAADGAAGALLRNAWGLVTVLDLYLALGLVWAWIAWRERSAGRAALWALALVLLGSIAAWGYVALAATRSRSPQELLLGHRAG